MLHFAEGRPGPSNTNSANLIVNGKMYGGRFEVTAKEPLTILSGISALPVRFLGARITATTESQIVFQMLATSQGTSTIKQPHMYCSLVSFVNCVKVVLSPCFDPPGFKEYIS